MRRLLALAFLVASTMTASAQAYPTRPVTMVVPFAAGGAFDVLGRLMAIRMGELLGQQVIVENTTGGGGTIGTLRVAQAAPDGYMFLFGSIGTHAYNPAIYKNLRYDPVGDFAPVALFADQPSVLVVRKDLPADDLQGFMRYARANSAKMQYGSAGVGSTTHLNCTLLNRAIGIETVHIPYRGGGPAAQGVLTGEIDYACLNLGGAMPLVAGNVVKGIALLSRDRIDGLPNLRTAHEQGLTDFDVSAWNAFFLPKGTPQPIIDKLNQVTSQAIDTPALKAKLHEIGITAYPPEKRSTAYLAQYVKDELARWAAPIRAAGIQAE
jgi:tripartite-type tricarboxylate transporter receptor subunit TctC